MPRNIEYLIDDYIEHKKYPNLVLTIAIQEGLDVPEEVLKVFGGGYGFDNERRCIDRMNKRKLQCELLLQGHSEKDEFSWNTIIRSKQDKYTKALNIYNEYKSDHEKEKAKLTAILIKFDGFAINNEKQRAFAILLKCNIERMIAKMDSELKEKEPIEETAMEVYLRLKNARNQEIKDARDYIAYYNNYINFDYEFFEELIKDWFGSRLPPPTPL